MKRLLPAIIVIGLFALFTLGTPRPLLAQETLQTGGTDAHFGTHRLVSAQTIRIATGGNLNAPTLGLGAGCVGWVTATPDVIVHWRERSNADLHFAVEAQGDGDTTLIIRAPDGTWHCNDDTSGLNPEVWVNGPPQGQYDIWVGSYAREQQLRGTLSMDGRSPRPQLRIGGSASNFGTHRLVSTQTVQVRSGGNLNAGTMGLGSACLGGVTAIPDLIIHWNEGSGADLRFAVQSTGDTTLIINSADGTWQCNDDTTGLNPEVLIQNAPRGQYDVWVGSYENGAQLAASFSARAEGGAVQNQPGNSAASARRAVESVEHMVQAAVARGEFRIRDVAPEPGGSPRRIPRFTMPPLLLQLVQARDTYIAGVSATADSENVRVAYRFDNALLMYFYGDWQQAKRRFARLYGERCTDAQAYDRSTQAWGHLRAMAVAEGNTREVARLAHLSSQQRACRRPQTGR